MASCFGQQTAPDVGRPYRAAALLLQQSWGGGGRSTERGRSSPAYQLKTSSQAHAQLAESISQFNWKWKQRSAKSSQASIFTTTSTAALWVPSPIWEETKARWLKTDLSAIMMVVTMIRIRKECEEGWKRHQRGDQLGPNWQKPVLWCPNPDNWQAGIIIDQLTFFQPRWSHPPCLFWCYAQLCIRQFMLKSESVHFKLVGTLGLLVA